MNPLILEKVAWFIKNIWGPNSRKYLKSFGLEYDPEEKRLLDFLSEINDDIIIAIINTIFMDGEFKNAYRINWNINFVGIRDQADALIELLRREGYETEKLKIKSKRGIPPVSSMLEKIIEDTTSISNKFYSQFINDINKSYQVGLFSVTRILIRVILENLLIDILRTKYGTKNLDVYY